MNDLRRWKEIAAKIKMLMIMLATRQASRQAGRKVCCCYWARSLFTFFMTIVIIRHNYCVLFSGGKEEGRALSVLLYDMSAGTFQKFNRK